jgi:hypothetical protein
MNYKDLSVRASTLIGAAFVFAASAHAGDVAVVSPDKRWEYQVSNGIVRAGTTDVVVDLFDAQEIGEAEKSGSAPGARVVWAPDSKRFAFIFRQRTQEAYYDVTVVLYQLRGDKWVRLRSPVDSQSDRGQLAQLVKVHLPKGEIDSDILRVRNWTDANTAILYANSHWKNGAEASFLFTLRFDAEGNSKIIETKRMSAKEAKVEEDETPEGG